MKKDNWRFEALARAKIVRQEELADFLKLTEGEKKIAPFADMAAVEAAANEIERLQNINAELLEALKLSRQYLSKMVADDVQTVLSPQTALNRINKAIGKSEGRE